MNDDYDRVAGIREHGRALGWSEEYIERLIALQQHCDAQPIDMYVAHFKTLPNGEIVPA